MKPDDEPTRRNRYPEPQPQAARAAAQPQPRTAVTGRTSGPPQPVHKTPSPSRTPTHPTAPPAQAPLTAMSIQRPPVPATIPTPPPRPVAKPAARLLLRSDNGDNGDFPLGDQNVLGRSTGASVRLADREVSRKHSQIDREGDDFVLKDLGSSNGTFLNGKRIFGPARLKDGDEVVIGTSKMEFHLVAGAPRATKKDLIEITMGDEQKDLAGIVARLDTTKGFSKEEDITDVQQLRRDYERLRIGHEFSRIVRLEHDLTTLLQRILDLAFDLIPADSGVILLRDRVSGELVIQAMKQRKPGQGKVLVSETLLRQVTATKEGVLSSDAIGDERFQSSHSIIALGVRSAMAVPLLTGDESVKGVMFLDSRERIAAFTTKDLEVLTAVAAQASVALENSDYARALEHEATQRAQLSRFLSPALVEQAARGSIELSKGGDRKSVV